MCLNVLKTQNKANINMHVLELFKDVYMYGNAVNDLALPELTEVENICNNVVTLINCRKEEILKENVLRENDEKLKKIILAKCDEREREGYDYLTDSDIMDIIEECERKRIEVTRKKLEEFIGVDD